VGIDVSPDMIAVARKTFPSFSYHEGDMVGWDFVGNDQMYRGIIVSNALQEVPYAEFPNFMKNVSDHLVNGGLFFANFREGNQEFLQQSKEYSALPMNRMMAQYPLDQVVITAEANGLNVIESRQYEKTKHGILQKKAELYAVKQ
jgi:trans-aconitate methyltransferase